MKKHFIVIAFVCLMALTLCGCDEQKKNEDAFQRNYTSLYVETYAGAQRTAQLKTAGGNAQRWQRV